MKELYSIIRYNDDDDESVDNDDDDDDEQLFGDVI